MATDMMEPSNGSAILATRPACGLELNVTVLNAHQVANFIIEVKYLLIQIQTVQYLFIQLAFSPRIKRASTWPIRACMLNLILTEKTRMHTCSVATAIVQVGVETFGDKNANNCRRGNLAGECRHGGQQAAREEKNDNMCSRFKIEMKIMAQRRNLIAFLGHLQC